MITKNSAAGGALAGEDLAVRDVDLLGQLADLLQVAPRQPREQRHVLQQLQLLVDLCHLSLIVVVSGLQVRAA